MKIETIEQAIAAIESVGYVIRTKTEGCLWWKRTVAYRIYPKVYPGAGLAFYPPWARQPGWTFSYGREHNPEHDLIMFARYLTMKVHGEP